MPELKYMKPALEAVVDLDNYYQWILDEIKPFFGSRLAEIGAGIGTFTEFLVSAHLYRSSVSQLEVFEPASDLYQRLQVRLTSNHPRLIQARRLVITEGYFKPSVERFDAVIMINVLEHIEDDLETIRIVYESLSSGGTFAVFVPALSWLYSAFDRAVGHHRRYDKKALERLFLEGGFDVIKAQYMDCLGVIPWYLLNVVGRSKSINPHLARFYDTWVIPLTRWVESLRNPSIGKNILVVGKKNARYRDNEPISNEQGS